jgi:hypothetical protein
MTSEDATTLFHLRGCWGDAYRIVLTDGVWAAQRIGATVVLTADTGQELRDLMQDDYGAWLLAGRAATS